MKHPVRQILCPACDAVNRAPEAKNASAAAELGVSGIPTLILFRDGRVVARQSGAISAGQIVAWTTQALAGAAA